MVAKNLALMEITKEYGATTSRPLDVMLAEFGKNVKDFGATGDGVTDDLAAIQAAIGYATSPYTSAKRGRIYFPLGTYNLSASALFASSIRYFEAIAEPGTLITGSFADALFKRAVDSPFGGIYRFQGFDFQNGHTTGKDLMIHSCVGATVIDCKFSAYRAIETYNSQAISIIDCDIIRNGATTESGSIGIVAGNATSVITPDISGYDHGIRHQNVGLVVVGGRMEVNNKAIVLGQDQDGNTLGSHSILISGVSFESNGKSVEAVAANTLHLSALNCGGDADTYSITHALDLATAENVTVSAVNAGYTNVSASVPIGLDIGNVKRAHVSSSNFAHNGVEINGGVGGTRDVVFDGVSANVWTIAADVESYELRHVDHSIDDSDLPTDPRPGAIYIMNDATTPAIGSAYTGGGATAAIIQAQTDGSFLVVGL